MVYSSTERSRSVAAGKGSNVLAMISFMFTFITSSILARRCGARVDKSQSRGAEVP